MRGPLVGRHDTTAAETFWVAVDTTTTIYLNYQPGVSYDDRANAATVFSGSVAGNTLGATHEPGEPGPGVASVWYRFTATATGTARPRRAPRARCSPPTASAGARRWRPPTAARPAAP